MQPTTAFSSKAEKYARYRWDYAPQAAQVMAEIAGLHPRARVVDIGAGTGIFTRHLLGAAGLVIAVEPNHEMRQIAGRQLAGTTNLLITAATAEATGLASGSVDLIAAATAFNWFDPLPTRAEFARILKPGGCLAHVTNRPTSPDFGPDLAALYPPQTGTSAVMKGASTPIDFYLDTASMQRLSFPITMEEDWEQFLGGLASASYAPDENHPLYPAFERGARALFDRFHQGGKIILTGVTQLTIGRIAAGLA